MSTPEQREALRDALGGGPTRAQRQRQRARALEACSPPARQWSWRWSWGVVGGLAVAMALVQLRAPRPPVAFADRRPVAVGAPLVVPEGVAPLVLEFDEDSRVVVSADSEAMVRKVTPGEVEVVLSRGHLEAAVTKGTGRVWRYAAGPWTVRVVGTRLSVDWAPARADVAVGVTEGEVEVTGPGLATPRRVRAGEQWRSEPRAASAGGAPAEPAVDAGPRVMETVELTWEDLAPVAKVDAGTRARAVAARQVDAGLGWQALLAQGLRAEALTAAGQVGALAHPEQLSDAEALDLADEARHARRPEVAHALLAVVAARGAGDAAEASFLLARMAVEGRDFTAAEVALRRSLALDASGPFAEQARGRLIEVLQHGPGGPPLLEAAREYLAHSPGGSWAGAARAVLEREGAP